MLERLADMPDGVLGFRATEKVTAADYRDVLEPALREAAQAGEIRLLYVLDGDVGMDAGAMVQDARTGLELGIGHRAAWRRSAVVTDAGWVSAAMRLLGWMMPGELRVFGASELDAARAWVAG